MCQQEAADLFRWSSRVNPSDDRTWMNWALMERRRGRADPARRLFRSDKRLTRCWVTRVLVNY